MENINSSTFTIQQLLPKSSFPRLIQTLKEKVYQVVGPTVQDGSIKWSDIDRMDDLPIGWRDEQQPGQYGLGKTDSKKIFDIVHGPESLNRQTFGPREPPS